MEENTFWFKLWSIAAIAIITLATLLTLRSVYEDTLVSRMVLAGADPIASKCSLTASATNTFCYAYLIAKKQND